MSLTPADIKKVAHLARLAIAETEIDKYTQELSKIIDFVNQMDSIDTSSVTAMAHPLDINQPLRSDNVTEINERELFQSIAPMVEAGLYLVPKVVE